MKSTVARRALALLLTALMAAALTAIKRHRKDPEPAVRVVVNIPAARIDVWVDDTLAHSYTIAVGAPKYQTPVGEFAISEVAWNPSWQPPESDWASDEVPQQPGPNNPMGRVKLKFAPLYFLHGTPDTSSLGRPRSHGCIRMRNADAIELARIVMAGREGTDPLDVDAVLAGRTTRTIALTSSVPLSVIYNRIEANDSLITLHPDPYHIGTPDLMNAVATLDAAGTGGVVDTVRLRALLALPATRRVIVARSSIVQTP